MNIHEFEHVKNVAEECIQSNVDLYLNVETKEIFKDDLDETSEYKSQFLNALNNFTFDDPRNIDIIGNISSAMNLLNQCISLKNTHNNIRETYYMAQNDLINAHLKFDEILLEKDRINKEIENIKVSLELRTGSKEPKKAPAIESEAGAAHERNMERVRDALKGAYDDYDENEANINKYHLEADWIRARIEFLKEEERNYLLGQRLEFLIKKEIVHNEKVNKAKQALENITNRYNSGGILDTRKNYKSIKQHFNKLCNTLFNLLVRVYKTSETFQISGIKVFNGGNLYDIATYLHEISDAYSKWRKQFVEVNFGFSYKDLKESLEPEDLKDFEGGHEVKFIPINVLKSNQKSFEFNFDDVELFFLDLDIMFNQNNVSMPLFNLQPKHIGNIEYPLKLVAARNHFQEVCIASHKEWGFAQLNKDWKISIRGLSSEQTAEYDNIMFIFKGIIIPNN